MIMFHFYIICLKRFHIQTVCVRVAPLLQMFLHMRWRDGCGSAGVTRASTSRWCEPRPVRTHTRPAASDLNSSSKGVCGGTEEGLQLLTPERVSRSRPGFPTLSVHLLPKFLSGREGGPGTTEVCHPWEHGIIALNWHSQWMHSGQCVKTEEVCWSHHK